jgi:transketolase
MSRGGSPTTLQSVSRPTAGRSSPTSTGTTARPSTKRCSTLALTKARPTLICCKTRIGLGSPNKVGTHDVHGAPLGAAEIAAARSHIGWQHAPFEIPDEVYAQWDGRMRGNVFESNWNVRFASYRAAFPELAAEFSRRMRAELPADWTAYAARTLAEIAARGENIATRKASQNAIEAFAPHLPELIGGSADLAGSNLTLWKGSKGDQPK